MPKQSTKTHPTVTFKILLVGYYPEIWRTIRVPTAIALPSLHDVIQTCMGWTHSHLYEFSHYNMRFADGSSQAWDGDGDGAEDLRCFRLSHFFHDPGDELTYKYDFGDDWDHRLTAIEFGQAVDGDIAICLNGERECPPEDVGGVHGFRGFLQAMADPKHSEHKSLMGWYGGAFDPLEFDLENANTALKTLKVNTQIKRGKSRRNQVFGMDA